MLLELGFQRDPDNAGPVPLCPNKKVALAGVGTAFQIRQDDF